MYFISDCDFVWVLFGLTACRKSCPFNLLRLTPSGRNTSMISNDSTKSSRHEMNKLATFCQIYLFPFFKNPRGAIADSMKWEGVFFK